MRPFAENLRRYAAAALAADGVECGQCRKQYEEADARPPCDEGDIDEEGLCPFGFPELDRDNVFAVEIWSDLRALGDVALALHDLALTPREKGDLLAKLRVLALVEAEHRKAKADEAKTASKREG